MHSIGGLAELSRALSEAANSRMQWMEGSAYFAVLLDQIWPCIKTQECEQDACSRPERCPENCRA